VIKAPTARSPRPRINFFMIVLGLSTPARLLLIFVGPFFKWDRVALVILFQPWRCRWLRSHPRLFSALCTALLTGGGLVPRAPALALL
jgi:hypothetical protein